MSKKTRREFLKSSAGAICAAGVASSNLPERASLPLPPGPAGLSLEKGLVMSMLPEKLSVADRFKLARDTGFSVIQAPTTPDARQAEEIKSAADSSGVRVDSVMNMDHWKYPLSSGDPAVVETSLRGMRTSLNNAKLWGSDAVLLVPAVVSQIAREREARELVTWYPTALGADLAPALGARGIDVHPMPAADPADTAERRRLREVAARADLGLTGVDLAIAETGTLVLVSGAGRPRSTSLLPPCHVAVFDRTALLESLRQVGVFLEAWHRDGRPPAGGAAINFITGPSRTADIELTLTRGVHGPKEVHAIFVEQPIRG